MRHRKCPRLQNGPTISANWARARERNAKVGADDYLPRAWFGERIRPTGFRSHSSAARAGFSSSIFDRAEVIAPNMDRRNPADHGETVEADRVLLALGNSFDAGPVPGVTAGDAVANAWNLDWIEKFPTDVPRVLLIGSGRTMIDIALAIADQRPYTRNYCDFTSRPAAAAAR